jgi:hypothetical protein
LRCRPLAFLAHRRKPTPAREARAEARTRTGDPGPASGAEALEVPRVRPAAGLFRTGVLLRARQGRYPAQNRFARCPVVMSERAGAQSGLLAAEGRLSGGRGVPALLSIVKLGAWPHKRSRGGRRRVPARRGASSSLMWGPSAPSGSSATLLVRAAFLAEIARASCGDDALEDSLLLCVEGVNLANLRLPGRRRAKRRGAGGVRAMDREDPGSAVGDAAAAQARPLTLRRPALVDPEQELSDGPALCGRSPRAGGPLSTALSAPTGVRVSDAAEQ